MHRLYLLFLLLTCVLNSHLYADSISIGDVSLPVDEYLPIDQTTVKVVVFSQTKIVKKDDLEREILNLYVSNSDNLRSLGIEFWKRMTESSLKIKRYDLAARSMMGVLIRASEKDFKEIDWVESVLSESLANPDLVKSIGELEIFQNLSRNIKVIVFYFMARADLNWLRANFTGQITSDPELFKSYSESRLKDAIISGDLLEAERAVSIILSILNVESQRYLPFKLAVDLLKQTSLKGAPKSINDILPLISLRNSSATLRDVLKEPIITKLHTLAEYHLSNGQPDNALEVISYITKDDRTPTTHKIIVQILNKIEINSRVISSKPVKGFLSEIVEEDQVVRSSYIDFLVRKFTAYAEGHRVNESKNLLKEIVSLRSDPSPDNDALRLKIAHAYLFYEDRTSAKEILDQNAFSLGISDRVRLFRGGYYGDPMLYVILLSIPLVIKFSIDIFRSGSKKRVVSSSTKRTYNHHDYDTEDSSFGENDGPAFVTGGSARQLNPLIEEYAECLKIFNIKEGSDLKAIKVAYRNAVKEVHPDLNINKQASSEDSMRFMELTKAYDRLCELHKLLGFPL